MSLARPVMTRIILPCLSWWFLIELLRYFQDMQVIKFGINGILLVYFGRLTRVTRASESGVLWNVPKDVHHLEVELHWFDFWRVISISHIYTILFNSP